MLGWQIFKHAILMIVRNISDIFKLAALPFLIAAAVYVLMIFWAFGRVDPIANDAPPQFIFSILIGFVAFGFCGLWFVVSWHRFVLLEELPRGWLNMPKAQLLGYLWAVIKLTLILVAGMIPVAIVAFIFSGAPIVMSVVFFLAACVLGYLAVRISLILPAAAVGSKLTISDALNETEGHLGDFVILLLCFLVLGLLMQVVVFVMSFVPILGVLAGIAVQLFSSLLNVSVMTTLYGYFIEKRPV